MGMRMGGVKLSWVSSVGSPTRYNLVLFFSTHTPENMQNAFVPLKQSFWNSHLFFLLMLFLSCPLPFSTFINHSHHLPLPPPPLSKCGVVSSTTLFVGWKGKGRRNINPFNHYQMTHYFSPFSPQMKCSANFLWINKTYYLKNKKYRVNELPFSTSKVGLGHERKSFSIIHNTSQNSLSVHLNNRLFHRSLPIIL